LAPYELPFAGGLRAYLSYDLCRCIERRGEHARDDLGLPLASVGLYAWALISDHQAGTSQLVYHPRLDARQRQRRIALFSEET
ncbi:aminodeoxychorismate synthase component I, partial [Pseudomonas aeruginosa]